MLKYLLIIVTVIAGIAVFGFTSKPANNSALVSYNELNEKINQKADFILLDVRTQEEFNEGHIPTATLLPYDLIEKQANSILPEKNKAIIVYCRSGRRSAIAATALQKLNYTNVRDFGGINRWQGILEK